jgi:hypothetical protein
MTASEDQPPMRWRDYLLERGTGLDQFWAEHLAARERSVLLVVGRGFDPRMRLGLECLLRAGGHGTRDVLSLEMQEGETPSCALRSELTEANWAALMGAVAGKGTVTTSPLPFWSAEGRRVGARNAANLFDSHDQLRAYSDVVIDISALPRGIYYPLVARLLYLLDTWPSDGQKPNLHVLVAEDPALDARITEEGVDESAEFLYSFGGRLSQEATAEYPKVWIPLLGEGRTTQFDRIYDLVKPDEVCPVLPSPSRDPRRGDNLLLQYRTLLFDQLSLDHRSFIYASEHNPFEVYRQVRRAALHYYQVLQLLGGCKVALSALSSKLMSLGALLVAYELKQANFDIGVAHIECQGYTIDSRETNPELVGLWLSGECYDQ